MPNGRATYNRRSGYQRCHGNTISVCPKMRAVNFQMTSKVHLESILSFARYMSGSVAISAERVVSSLRCLTRSASPDFLDRDKRKGIRVSLIRPHIPQGDKTQHSAHVDHVASRGSSNVISNSVPLPVRLPISHRSNIGFLTTRRLLTFWKARTALIRYFLPETNLSTALHLEITDSGQDFFVVSSLASNKGRPALYRVFKRAAPRRSWVSKEIQWFKDHYPPSTLWALAPMLTYSCSIITCCPQEFFL